MVDSAEKEAWLAGGGGYNRWTSATDHQQILLGLPADYAYYGPYKDDIILILGLCPLVT